MAELYIRGKDGRPRLIGKTADPELPGRMAALEARMEVIESAPGGVPLSDAVDSASGTTAATSKAVKTAYDTGVAAAAAANTAQNAAGTAKTAADAAKTAAATAQAKANSAYTEATKAASTEVAGRVRLSDAVNSSVSTTAATSKAVKTAHDKAGSAVTAAAAAQSDADTAQSTANAAKSAAATAQAKADAAYEKATAATAYITETWHSGANWYRKWSDGFIEQGGLTNLSASIVTVTLNIPFTAIGYNVVVSKFEGGTEDGYAPVQGPVAVASRGKTSFKAGSGAEWGSDKSVSWAAFGY